jgi:hypothetical protein
MRNRTLLVCIALVSPLVAAAADDVPPWLKDAAAASLPSYPAKVLTVVLLNEEHTTAAENGKLSTTTRTAMKILQRQGGDITFSEQYDSVSGRVKDFRAWMIAPSGKVKRYGKDEIADVACVNNDVYNECRRRVVSGKSAAEAGSVFAYEATTESQEFSNQLLFAFQESSPVRTARFVVTVPAGWEVKTASFNGAPREASPAGGTFTWQMENLAAIEPEEAAPVFLTIVPWVGVNLLGPGGKHPVLSWTDAAKLLSELNDGQAEANPAIQAKAQSLVQGAATEMDKIHAIATFTQQLNYVSIQVNVARGGGYRPHPAAQTFQKLYGDCKDKANLTRAMLKAVGITAYPVAIYSGDRTHVKSEWPSLGEFNHAITAIRVSAETKAPAVLEHPKMGRLLFFDPTDSYVQPGYIPEHEQDSLALIGAGDAGDLVRVPAGRAVAAAHTREAAAVLGADGSITGSFVDRRTGEEYANAAASYRASPHDDYVKMIERWVGRSIPGATTTSVEASDANSEFSLKAQFASARFAQRPQARMLIFKAALLPHGELRLTEKVRKYPVVLDTDALNETVRIQLPADFKVDELPPAIKLTSPFGTYEATWTVEGGSVVMKRSLEMPAQTVPVAQYEQLRKFFNTVNGSGESPVVLVR